MLLLLDLGGGKLLGSQCPTVDRYGEAVLAEGDGFFEPFVGEGYESFVTEPDTQLSVLQGPTSRLVGGRDGGRTATKEDYRENQDDASGTEHGLLLSEWRRQLWFSYCPDSTRSRYDVLIQGRTVPTGLCQRPRV